MVNIDIKEILTLKSKYRHDGFSDQFSRIFITKILLVCAIVVGMDLYNDHLSCYITEETEPDDSDASKHESFIEAACWAQGLYVYRDLPRDSSIYHGVPKNLQHDGYNDLEMTYNEKYEGCETKRSKPHERCIPFTKVFYTQYQYFPYYIACLAALYYLPYIMFQLSNHDLVNLKNSVSEPDVNSMDNVKRFIDNYFDYANNGGVVILRVKVLFNLAIKMAYVVVNVGSFLLTDHLLNGDFRTYGFNRVQWFLSKTTLHGARNGYRSHPGNILLPTIGICEVPYSFKSKITTQENNLVLMCEMSGHVLYQYVLLVLWIFFLAGNYHY